MSINPGSCGAQTAWLCSNVKMKLVHASSLLQTFSFIFDPACSPNHFFKLKCSRNVGCVLLRLSLITNCIVIILLPVYFKKLQSFLLVFSCIFQAAVGFQFFHHAITCNMLAEWFPKWGSGPPWGSQDSQG